MSANAHRGEFPIRLEETDYVMRADYEAVAAIDEQLGSILDVAQRALTQGSISLREMAVIVCEGLKAHGRKEGNPLVSAYNPRRVGEMIFETGATNCLKPICQFLVAALNGGVIAGNGEAAAEPPTK